MRNHRHRALRMQNPETSTHHGRRGHGRFGGGGGGGGHRRRKAFDGDALRLMVLQLIAEQPRHGYDLIRALGERSGGAWSPSPGMVYPLLTLLADMGHIREAEPDGSRKRFTVTDEGRAELAASAAAIAALMERLGGMAQQAARVDPAPVRRAMHNLRSALIARLERADASDETVFAAVALIDKAAQEVEKL